MKAEPSEFNMEIEAVQKEIAEDLALKGKLKVYIRELQEEIRKINKRMRLKVDEYETLVDMNHDGTSYSFIYKED